METLLGMLLGLSSESAVFDELMNVLTSMDNVLINLQTQVIYMKESIQVLFYISIASTAIALISLICVVVLIIKMRKVR